MNDATVLRFREVSKVYRDAGGAPRYALRDVSVDVRAGRVVAIIGRSGSGKSTFLHVAAGIDEPTSGIVELCGRDLAELPDRRRTVERRDRVGVVAGESRLPGEVAVVGGDARDVRGMAGAAN